MNRPLGSSKLKAQSSKRRPRPSSSSSNPGPWSPRTLALAALLGLSFLPIVALAAAPATPLAWPDRIEADWIRAEELAAQSRVSEAPTTRTDAAGGCDGVKNGEWGFHTGEAENAWWQVDLGQAQAIERVTIWNRRETPERAAKIRVLLSNDGTTFRQVYQHDGTTFQGFTDGKPLVVPLSGEPARFVRLSLPGRSFLHLDEIEVFGPADPAKNLALHQPADQVSVSQWSSTHAPRRPVDWGQRTAETLTLCARLLAEEAAGDQAATTHTARPVARGKTKRSSAARDSRLGLGQTRPTQEGLAFQRNAQIEGLRQRLAALAPDASARPLFLEARRMQRELALRTPLLQGFEALLFTKRVPASFNHMSDQYYGWWSKPGGGIFLLRGFTSGSPTEQCLTTSFTQPGSFLRPTLSYDARKVLFAWCRHYPELAAEPNKLDKTKVPEDAFYHLFEMNLDGSDVRQLTHGKYDDFDGRYLPDGRIVFLSTRRGQALQVGRESASRTVTRPDLPDSYVRCGGGPERPVAVYTLHTMNTDGADLTAISPFEMFEWTPEVAEDGSIIYSRWDYVDRDNMPYMGLWSIGPDGANARIVYGNFAKAPHCAFEAKPVPGSHKIVFTASAHHAQTMGSLVLLDPSVGSEGTEPLTRLTPEVPFPEIEGWPRSSYANPWPFNERHLLVAWGCEGARVPGPSGWDRWHAVQRPPDGTALYLYDAAAQSRELLWADPEIACGDPIPVRARPRPPVLASQLAEADPKSGSFLLTDVYRGLTGVERGAVKALRLVAVPAKTHPTMNFPVLGIMRDDPGKCVLGTVPVEADGSAHFLAPAGVTLFFQALDERGLALQTMRSATHVQPGQTLGCIGCHESREQAPPTQPALASTQAPSRLTPGPDGSWPLRFDQLIQPFLDARCVSCHQPQATNAVAAKFDLTPAKAYETLIAFGKPSLQDVVRNGYSRGYSIPGEGLARQSALLALLDAPKPHYDITLTAEDRERLATWMDTYAQRLGHFSDEQEQELVELRRACAGLLIERQQSALPRPDGANKVDNGSRAELTILP